MADYPPADSIITTSTIVAALLAPVAGIAAVALAMTVLFAFISPEPSVTEAPFFSGFSFVLFYFLLFGLPGAYVLEVIIGVPSLRALSRTGRLRLPYVLTISGGAGALAFAVPWSLFFPPPSTSDVLLVTLLGAFGGAVAGVVLWVVDFRKKAV